MSDTPKNFVPSSPWTSRPDDTADATSRVPTRTYGLVRALPFLAPDRIEQRLPSILRALAIALDRIRDGEAPTEADLADAPVIASWELVFAIDGIHLAGIAVGHPRLPAGPVTTSAIWAADPAGRWVRTLSRFYVTEAPSPKGLAQIEAFATTLGKHRGDIGR